MYSFHLNEYGDNTVVRKLFADEWFGNICWGGARDFAAERQAEGSQT